MFGLGSRRWVVVGSLSVVGLFVGGIRPVLAAAPKVGVVGGGIFFVTEGEGLVRVNSDGSGRLVVVKGIDGDVAVSPDGVSAYTYDQAASPSVIVSYGVKTRRRKVVVPFDGGESGVNKLKVAGDGRRLYFENGSDAVGVDVTGKGLWKLPMEDSLNEFAPTPNSKEFVVSVNSEGAMYVASPKGVPGLVISDGSKFAARWPDVSPDGKRVAFSIDTGDSYDLFVLGLDGQGLTKVTDTSENEQFPDWSPDGKRLVFVSKPSDDGPWDIATINVDGSGRQMITRSAVRDFSPSWTK